MRKDNPNQPVHPTLTETQSSGLALFSRAVPTVDWSHALACQSMFQRTTHAPTWLLATSFKTYVTQEAMDTFIMSSFAEYMFFAQSMQILYKYSFLSTNKLSSL